METIYVELMKLFPNIKTSISLDDLELNIKTKYVVKSFFANKR